MRTISLGVFRVPEPGSCFSEFTKGPRVLCKFVFNYLTHMFLFGSVRDPDYESESESKSERSVPGMRLRMDSTCMCVCGKEGIVQEVTGKIVYHVCLFKIDLS